MAQPYSVNVLEHSHIAPPQGSVSTTTVPLTFLDVAWLFCCPIQRIIFYEFPYPVLHFTETILPNLKHSLSLTLRHFFPFAATLRCPPPPDLPYLFYNEGDSVQVTVAESDADFCHLVSNHARDNREFQTLVPVLPMAKVTPHTEQVAPTMAIQITVFPNSGISIGVTFNHVAADGRSFNHFFKSWASIYRSGGEALTSLSLPCHNKDVIKDPDGISSIYLQGCLNSEYSGSAEGFVTQDNVRITLALRRPRIEKLKDWVTTRILRDNNGELGPIRISTFVVTCGFMWVSLMKLQETETRHRSNNDTLYYCIAGADCRERFGLGIPATYFGNCVAFMAASAKRSELMEENGVAIASKAIANMISDMEKGPLNGADKWNSKAMEIVKHGRLISVAGSPKFRFYDIDFGWGTPKKSEVAHIGINGAFSLHELRDEEGGIEIGLVLGRDKLKFFNELFEQGLELNIH